MAMDETQAQKPSYEEWMYWSQVIIDRLTTIIHVYNKPPYPEVFMPDNERQLKVSLTVDVLRRLHTLTDENDFRAGLKSSDMSENRVIADIQPLFRDVLHRLPTLSLDMQRLLKSPWYDKCSGKVANELFRGRDDREAEGIGSGHPEHGRLPEVSAWAKESMGGDPRRFREGKPRTPGAPAEELARLWGKAPGAFLLGRARCG